MLDLAPFKDRTDWLKFRPAEYKYAYTVDPVTGHHVGPDCIRCGAKDCHPHYRGYCGIQCSDAASDEEDIAELVDEIECLRREVARSKGALSVLLEAVSSGSDEDINICMSAAQELLDA
jgi:hypothetical protein